MLRMLKRRMLMLVLLVVGLGAGRAVAVGDPSVRWPLDLGTRYLTSNFMEYRSGRFHAGIDLKTQSQPGFPAYAVEDGWILRVRATPNAYGRVVYLRGVSGRTYVYAHLSRFNDTIREQVGQARQKSGRYRVRLSFAPAEIPIRKGQVLGLTGQSGTNGPHLHFEVRDKSNRPINPFMAGFAVPDTFAPVIHAIRAIPAAVSSRVEGHAGAAVLKRQDSRSLAGTLPGVSLEGPVAFSVKITDAADIRGHVLEPWLIEARLDGRLVYRCANEKYDFAENSLQRLEWLELPGIRDRWLHRRPANSLTGRSGDLWYLGDDGTGLGPGRHDLVIMAADQAGNRVEATLELVVADSTSLEETAAATRSKQWILQPAAVYPDTATALTEGYLSPFFHVMDQPAAGVDLITLTPADGDPVHAAATLSRRSEALDEVRLAQAARQGLKPLGSGVEFMAADWPIEASVTVELPGYTPADTVPADTLSMVHDPAVRAYRWSRGQWLPAGRLVVPAELGMPLRMALGAPGYYSVFRDEAGPLITVAKGVVGVTSAAPSQIPGVTLPRWTIFPVGLVDLGSGIASESILAFLNGGRLVVEPDLLRDRVLVELPDDLPSGTHELRLEVRDDAGHRAEAVMTLECRP